MEWETVIGLEIHAQLLTRSKIFSGSATAYGAPPNSQANLVDLAYPGVLPVLNAEAVRMAVKFGLAINARVTRRSIFARKNYFYPDLPKGYQISQYELPIVSGGAVDILLDDGSVKRIDITRAHLEEDAGKSLHEGLAGLTGVDLNRAGTPLIEIVSEPVMRSAKQAVAYLKKIHTLVRYLHICDGNMQEGSFRCDANVSVRPRGTEKLGTRAEIKNLNSFRFVEKAINYEVARQIELLEGGGQVVQETRLYDADRGETRSMRSKEEANDYRYFPDPDLLPVEIDQLYIDTVCASLPELPDQKAQRLRKDYDLSAYDAGVLTASAELADYYETVIEKAAADFPDIALSPKLAANTVIGELSGLLNRDGVEISDSRIAPAALANCWLELPTTPSRARSPRTCSRRCGTKARMPTRSSRRAAGARLPMSRRSKPRSTPSSRPIRRSWRSIAPARTSCSGSSSARR
jgi:aspartyl-tRNA(Asn)/glutamyl-tRNA(Gln) amidotransferase subunit B